MGFIHNNANGDFRRPTIAIGIGLCLLASGGLAATASAAAGPLSDSAIGSSSDADSATPEAPAADAALPEMGEYPAADYVEQATQLPVELVAALHRDLQITPAEYLAAAAATTDAIDVVAGLKNAGVSVLGSRLEGTTLVVNLGSASDTATAEAAGAVVELGKPPQESIKGLKFHSAANVYGGTGYYLNGYQCSLGFNGYRTSDASGQALTAGHCLESTTPRDPVYTIDSSQPGIGTDVDFSTPIAYPLSSAFGSGYDSGMLSLAAGTVGPSSIATWGGGRAGALSSAPLPIRGEVGAVVGANLCKSGSRTGWTCGKVVVVDQTVIVNGGTVINSILATTCILPGASGGAAVIGQFAAGLNSTTSNADSCAGEDYRSGYWVSA